MSEQAKPREKLPGLSYESLKAAVGALTELRDAGKYIVFLSRHRRVRFIGRLEDFRTAYVAKLQQDTLNEKDAITALTEIANFLDSDLALGDRQRLVRFLEDNVFEDDFKKQDTEGKRRLREHLKSKAELCSSQLLTEAITLRAKRLSTVTGPSLEDVDAEVISERHDQVADQKISGPFLRLRLRYSEGTNEAFPYFLIPPWSSRKLQSPDLKSFELEFDEADIDLMMNRLVAAKELLLRAVDQQTKASTTGG